MQKLYRLAAHDTPTSKKLLKLQLGAISISDIEMVKRMGRSRVAEQSGVAGKRGCEVWRESAEGAAQ